MNGPVTAVHRDFSAASEKRIAAGAGFPAGKNML